MLSRKDWIIILFAMVIFIVPAIIYGLTIESMTSIPLIYQYLGGIFAGIAEGVLIAKVFERRYLIPIGIMIALNCFTVGFSTIRIVFPTPTFESQIVALCICLFFGGLFTGIIEGTLIAKVFKRGYLATIGIMIVANYLSIFLCIGYITCIKGTNTFQYMLNQKTLLELIILMSVFCISIISEYPFYLASLHAKAHTWSPYLKRALLASILVNAVSNIIILPFYVYTYVW